MSTQAPTANPQELDTWFLELLRCPICEDRLALSLNSDKTRLNCASGRHAFPIRDGIPILLADEAIALSDASPTEIFRTMKVSVIHGPNLNLLGQREAEFYGRESFDDINRRIKQYGHDRGMEVRIFQSNHEGEIIDAIQDASDLGRCHRHQSCRVYPLQLCDSGCIDGGASACD